MSELNSNEKYQVDFVQRKVFFSDNEVKIRSKSFELLQLLLASPNEVVSKEIMLSVIWDDVTVDEQVIFQSIKELRRAFGSTDVIKTYPRKGYAWVLDVEIISAETQIIDNSKLIHNDDELPIEKIAIEKPINKKTIKYKLTISCLFLLVLSLFIWKYSDVKIEQKQKVAGSIIVLPVKQSINDRNHKWVRIGVMDQLIQQLPASNDYIVMQVDDVLEIMKRIITPIKEFTAKEVEKIFVVSGASLIIETELNGTPGDYQLIYTLRRESSIERGVLLSGDIHEAIDELAQIVSDNIGKKTISVSSLNNRLPNQLLTQALEKKASDDYPSTEKYLKSLLEIEPDNYKAKRLLAEVSVYLKNTDQISQLVNSIVHDENSEKQILAGLSINQNREFARLKFWQGLNELQFGRIPQAQKIFEQTNKLLNKTQDWLYLGYLAEVKGHAHRSLKEYALANQFYSEAIKNHKIIKCPYGEVKNTLHLAEIAFLQGQLGLAQTLTSQSLTMANKRELFELADKANKVKEKYQ